jgi:hypothetical protein
VKFLYQLAGLVALGVLACSGSANAFSVTPVGTFEFSDIYNPPGSSTGTGWGYGVVLGQYVRSDLEVESAILYLARAYSQGNPTSLTSTYYYLEVPLLLRIQPSGSHLSFGLGGYYARGIGNIQNSPSSGAVTEVSYEQMQLSREDFGPMVAVGLRWGITAPMEIYADARFAYGIKNINLAPGGETEQWRDYLLAVAGVRFVIF